MNFSEEQNEKITRFDILRSLGHTVLLLFQYVDAKGFPIFVDIGSHCIYFILICSEKIRLQTVKKSFHMDVRGLFYI
ncbi:hypothetical protein BHE18_02895 [Rossellomorea aquimaris]|uniref:Uncharacterized protein n=1 Tax=Rossellomorea aquimaris TaxID=189382 RepID=A0A1J6W3T2_9BACI|nr:hypothetical protein BHE18_02895 [Rossellomorea aquimaris]